MKKRKVPTSLQPKVETNDNEGWQQLKIEDAIRQVNAASKLENAVGFQEVLDAFQTMNKHITMAKDQAEWLLQNSPYPSILGKFHSAGVLNDISFRLHWKSARTVIQLYDQMAEDYELESVETVDHTTNDPNK